MDPSVSDETDAVSEPEAFTPGIETSGWGAEVPEPDGWGDTPATPPPTPPPAPDSAVPYTPPGYVDPTEPSEPFAATPGDPLGSFAAPPAKTGMSTGAKIGLVVAGLFVLMITLVVVAVVSFVRQVPDTLIEELENFDATTFESIANDFDEFEFPPEIGAVDFGIGTCFDVPGVPIDCNSAHVYEVYALKELDQSTYPTWEDTWVGTSCSDEFDTYVDYDYFLSEFFYEVARPTPDQWDAGDHDIRCVLYIPNETIEGSARGAGY